MGSKRQNPFSTFLLDCAPLVGPGGGPKKNAQVLRGGGNPELRPGRAERVDAEGRVFFVPREPRRKWDHHAFGRLQRKRGEPREGANPEPDGRERIQPRNEQPRVVRAKPDHCLAGGGHLLSEALGERIKS